MFKSLEDEASEHRKKITKANQQKARVGDGESCDEKHEVEN